MKIHLPAIVEESDLVYDSHGYMSHKVYLTVTDEMVWAIFVHWLNHGFA